MSEARRAIVDAAVELVRSGYDGPFMGQEVEKLFNAVLLLEKEETPPGFFPEGTAIKIRGHVAARSPDFYTIDIGNRRSLMVPIDHVARDFTDLTLKKSEPKRDNAKVTREEALAWSKAGPPEPDDGVFAGSKPMEKSLSVNGGVRCDTLTGHCACGATHGTPAKEDNHCEHGFAHWGQCPTCNEAGKACTPSLPGPVPRNGGGGMTGHKPSCICGACEAARALDIARRAASGRSAHSAPNVEPPKYSGMYDEKVIAVLKKHSYFNDDARLVQALSALILEEVTAQQENDGVLAEAMLATSSLK